MAAKIISVFLPCDLVQYHQPKHQGDSAEEFQSVAVLRLGLGRKVLTERCDKASPIHTMTARQALHDLGIAPRLLTREQAAAYCGLSVNGFSDWVKAGRLPGSIPGTARWDLKAIDIALDSLSGIGIGSSALDQWKAKHARSS
jgi:hypothetical protein